MGAVGAMFSGLLTVFGGAVLAVVGALVAGGPEPVPGGLTTAATVVAVEIEDGARHRVLEFTADGTTHRIVDPRPVLVPSTIGSTVPVSYSPEDPLAARSLDRPGVTLALSIVVGAVGLGLVIAGSVVCVRRSPRSLGAPSPSAQTIDQLVPS